MPPEILKGTLLQFFHPISNYNTSFLSYFRFRFFFGFFDTLTNRESGTPTSSQNCGAIVAAHSFDIFTDSFRRLAPCRNRRPATNWRCCSPITSSLIQKIFFFTSIISETRRHPILRGGAICTLSCHQNSFVDRGHIY